MLPFGSGEMIQRVFSRSSDYIQAIRKQVRSLPAKFAELGSSLERGIRGHRSNEEHVNEPGFNEENKMAEKIQDGDSTQGNRNGRKRKENIYEKPVRKSPSTSPPTNKKPNPDNGNLAADIKNKNHDTQTPETSKPQIAQPEIKEPETKKQETKKPEMIKPEINQLETNKPVMNKPEMEEPEMKNQETKKPEMK